MSLALPPCQLYKNLQLNFADGWRYRHTDRLKHFAAYAFSPAADRRLCSVFLNMGFLQGLQVLFDMRPFKHMAGFFEMTLKFFTKDQRKKAAKDVSADGIVPLMKDRTGFKKGFHIPEHRILEPVDGKTLLFFTGSFKSSDFMVDGLLLWWAERKQTLSNVTHLVINMDNGPECSGRRTQFLQRMVEFVDWSRLSVRLIYYPPYHSKYNGIERYWAGLEKSWNRYLLRSTEEVLNRAANFFWKGVRTTVHLFNEVYEKGVRVCGKAKAELEARLERSEILPLYDIIIRP